MSTTSKLVLSFVVVVLGSILILANAVSYLFDFKWPLPSPAIGLIMLAVGIVMIRKNRGSQQDPPNVD